MYMLVTFLVFHLFLPHEHICLGVLQTDGPMSFSCVSPIHGILQAVLAPYMHWCVYIAAVVYTSTHIAKLGCLAIAMHVVA